MATHIDTMPLVISTISLAVSVTFASLALRDRRAAAKREQAQVLAEWAIKVIEAMSEAYHWLQARQTGGVANDVDRSKTLARLSALIDEGRWYFPNDKSIKYGLHKHELNQGFRSAVLDPPVAMYRLLAEIDSVPDNLLASRKDFVTRLGNHIQPFTKTKASQ